MLFRSIGVISVLRRELGAFDDKEVKLFNTFADQAVIAIENVRLFNETKEALERQTATAEILQAIASSPSDVQPVFDTIAQSARRLIGALSAAVTRVDGDMMHLAALTSVSPAGDEAVKRAYPQTVSAGTGNLANAIRSRAPYVIEDTETHPGLAPQFIEEMRVRGIRAVLGMPMMRAGNAIGAIGVARGEPGKFDEHQIKLLKTFADQAVIAIENVRLFNETKEALERQTATAAILQVIARSPSEDRKSVV